MSNIDYGDPSAIGLIQVRATVWYDAPNECLTIHVHSLRATGIVQHIAQVYVHASVAIHDSPVIPEEHLESPEIAHAPWTDSQHGPVVPLEQANDTIYDQVFRFVIHRAEFVHTTVVLDVFRRALGDEFFNDTLLGRTILVSPEMIAKNVKKESPTPEPAVAPPKPPPSKTSRKSRARRR